jgi:hypothetical protein
MESAAFFQYQKTVHQSIHSKNTQALNKYSTNPTGYRKYWGD